MKILAEQISKKFVKHSIFKNVSLSFENNNSYALLGRNGSGKSTLLRILAGIQNPTKGNITFSENSITIAPEEVYKHISFCAPAFDMVEEMTLSEMLQFHFSFKPILPSLTIEKIIDLIELQKAANTQLSNFSSGMKQRVKLAQAIFTNSSVLMLDEPCTNLDKNGVNQYRDWIAEYGKNKLVIIASNEEREYDFCSNHIRMEDLK